MLGEKWSLLVVRELALNVHRFDQIAKNTGAPRDILTSRLRRLEAEGVLEKRLYQEHPPRHEYYLTEAGDELRPILLSLSQWGERWTRKRSDHDGFTRAGTRSTSCTRAKRVAAKSPASTSA